MKILVGVKRVVDYAVKVRVTKGTVDLANVKQSMNPFCEVCMSKMMMMIIIIHKCIAMRSEKNAFRINLYIPNCANCFDSQLPPVSVSKMK